MYYQLYELNHAFLSPARALNDAVRLYYKNPLNPFTYTEFGRQMAAATDVFERVTRRYGKPEFGLKRTVVDGVPCTVSEEVVWERPFCKLLHFKRDLPESAPKQPNLVIVAPMSGHYATLLRGTVETLLPHFEVHITDWADARMVPLSVGTFDFADYVDYVTDITKAFDGDVHIVAVCQPTVPVFCSVAMMEKAGDIHPKSVTMMGGPLDTRESPTEVNTYAASHDLSWFRNNVVMTVPLPHPGFMRPVYPGFLQLTGFMTMNLDRHLAAHYDYFDHLVQGDGDSAEKHREFYDEYLSVMDLTAEFYLETVDYVFLRQLLPKGEMLHRGQPVDPGAITKTPLFTVEGEKDDISGIGQTRAAHRMTPNLPADHKQHYEQPGVGHYGVFNGSRFRKEIAPRIVEFVYRWDGPDRAPGSDRVGADVVAGMSALAAAAMDTPVGGASSHTAQLVPHVGAQAVASSFGAAFDRAEVQPHLVGTPKAAESALRVISRPFEHSAEMAAETAETMAWAFDMSMQNTESTIARAVETAETVADVNAPDLPPAATEESSSDDGAPPVETAAAEPLDTPDETAASLGAANQTVVDEAAETVETTAVEILDTAETAAESLGTAIETADDTAESIAAETIEAAEAAPPAAETLPDETTSPVTDASDGSATAAPTMEPSEEEISPPDTEGHEAAAPAANPHPEIAPDAGVVAAETQPAAGPSRQPAAKPGKPTGPRRRTKAAPRATSATDGAQAGGTAGDPSVASDTPAPEGADPAAPKPRRRRPAGPRKPRPKG